MKKKICFFISVIFSLVLLNVFCLNASAITGHFCSGGFDPVIKIQLNRVTVTGCRNCHQSFLLDAPYLEINFPNGQAFNEGEYKLPTNDHYGCASLLYRTNNQIIFLYEGCDGTNYPMTQTKPTMAGSYRFYITTKKLYNIYLSTGAASYQDTDCNGKTFTTQTMTVGMKFVLNHVHNTVYYGDGAYLCVKCTKCGEIETVSPSVSSGFRVGHIEPTDISVTYDGWSNLSNEAVVLLYEGRNNTRYGLTTTMPTSPGDYSVSVALKSKWEKNPSAISGYRSNGVSFSIDEDYHKWEYTADGCSITAKCRFCDANAKVTLDSSAVYEGARKYETESLKKEMFYEENWSSYSNIAQYQVIYNGKEIYDSIDDDSSTNIYTTKIYNSTVAPENSGNYVAYLAILKNKNDISPDSVIAKSAGLPFYIAGYSLKRCQVVEYGANEIAAFQEPESKDGVYYVGTLNDLLWCVYHQTTDMHIVLTNDIVVNPITVTEDGNVSSGALTIYKWKGFGYNNARFAGTIDGQGHTIYGLYFPECRQNDWVSGFICWGKNVQIKNLNIENSYIKASNAAGVFFGELQINGSKDACIVNCQSLNNLVIAGSEAGGFIGWLGGVRSTAANSFFKIENCVNSSFVNGVFCGGIVGKTCPTDDFICNGIINKCCNYGKITGTQYASGIVGHITLWHHLGITVTNCLNMGSIKATNYESGIIGGLFANGSGGALVTGCINVSNNINAGELCFTCSNIADIIAITGANNYCQNGLLVLKDNYYTQSKTAYPTSLASAPAATKLTNQQMLEGKICELFGHVPEDHYSDVVMAGCTTEGTKNIRCATCGEILETVTTAPHGHSYGADGKCTYCQTRKSIAASDFSDGTWIAVLAVTVSLVGAGIAVVTVRKKKKTSQAAQTTETTDSTRSQSE